MDIFGLNDLRELHQEQKINESKEKENTIKEVNKQYPKIVNDLKSYLTLEVFKEINYKLHDDDTDRDRLVISLFTRISAYTQVYFDNNIYFDSDASIDIDLFYNMIVSKLNNEFKFDEKVQMITSKKAHYYLNFSKICTNQICVNTVLGLIITDDVFRELKKRDTSSKLPDKLFLNLNQWFLDNGFTEIKKITSQKDYNALLKY